VIAKAHHGSVSKEQRALIEDDLKRGVLPAVVATSSLELGIDMGAVDLVVQIESPPSVASALQRVGRAGHQVGEVSRGVLFPKHRGDLAQTAVAVQRMRAGAIESLSVPTNPLDVLAQQVVSMVAMEAWSVDDLFDAVARHGLHFDESTQTGVVFHMISCLSECGRVGMTTVGETPEQAMGDLRTCSAHPSRRGQGRAPGR